MTIPAILGRSVVFGSPLALGLIEIGHPAIWPGDAIFATIHPIATWWTTLHVLQVPLFALLGLAVLLVVRGLNSRSASYSRYAIILFIVAYPAFDAAVGVSSGLICRTLPVNGGSSIEGALQELFWGPVTGTMAIIGAASWLIALTCAAIALRQSGEAIAVAALLVLSGLLLAISHVRPFGPLACLSFLIGAALTTLHHRGTETAGAPGS